MSEKYIWPTLGCGIGLRAEHYPAVLGEWPRLDWVEAVSENYMDTGGYPLHVLKEVRKHYPVVLHGVSLSIGSTDPLNQHYLRHLKELISTIQPAMVSDHLCWASVDKENLHDLLPLPFTEEAIRHIVSRVNQVQEYLGQRILLENVSSYITYQHSTIPEWQFLTEVSKRSGCGILLDINNVYVNSENHEFDPLEYIYRIPKDNIGYIHLAGHTHMGKWLFDTHSKPVIKPVWDLYRNALKYLGKKSTVIEWDEDIPEFDLLLTERNRAKKIYDETDIEIVESVYGDDEILEIDQSSDIISLKDLQKWMRTRVYPHKDEQSAISQVPLNKQAGDPGEERLEVYREGYWVRIREALAECYPTIQHVVGEHTFMHLAKGYAKEFPSNKYNLSLAGEKFGAFLKTTSVAEKLPFLPDLAILELAVNKAFHATDVNSLQSEQIASVEQEDWGNMILGFQPSTKLISSEWPLVDIWEARKTPIDQFNIQLVDRPQRILIFRKGFRVVCECLDPKEYEILERLSQGHSLGEVMDFIEQNEAFVESPQEWIQKTFMNWMNWQIFSSIFIGDSHEEANSLLR